MSKNNPGVIAGLLVAALGIAVAAPAQAGGRGVPQAAPAPARLCTAHSVEKWYSQADHDFTQVRDQLNALPAGKRLGHGGAEIPLAALRFRVRVDQSGCERIAGPVAARMLSDSRGLRLKDCDEAGCIDPAPGLGAPDGSTLVIWSCVNGVVREVEYEKVNGQWRVKSSRQDLVVSCPLPKDPGGGEPDPDPEPDKG